MNAPICEVCLKSDILCSGCKAKLDEGKISEADVKVSRYLYSLSEKIQSLKNAKIVKVVELADTMVILVGKGSAPIVIGKGANVLKSLSKNFGKNIKIIEEGSDIVKVAESILSVKPIAVNILYRKDGETYKFRLPSSMKQKVTISEENFSRLMKNITGRMATFVFES
jgi:transcription antitermination factor NusA-like protein